jgi:hypothetical protein
MSTPDAVATNSMQRALLPEEDKDKMLKTKPLAASITPFVQRETVNNEEPEDKEKPVQAKFSTEMNNESLQRQPETDEKEKEPIQAKSAGSMSGNFEAGGDVETQISQSKGRGTSRPRQVGKPTSAAHLQRQALGPALKGISRLHGHGYWPMLLNVQRSADNRAALQLMLPFSIGAARQIRRAWSDADTGAYPAPKDPSQLPTPTGGWNAGNPNQMIGVVERIPLDGLKEGLQASTARSATEIADESPKTRSTQESENGKAIAVVPTAL